MNSEVLIPWLDIGLKYTVVLFCTYYLFWQCAGESRSLSACFGDSGGTQPQPAWTKNRLFKTSELFNYPLTLFLSTVMGFLLIWIRPVITPMHHPLMLIFVILTNCLIYSKEPKQLTLRYTVTLSLFCYAYCVAVFLLVGFIGAIPLSFVYEKMIPAGQNSYMDFLRNVPVHIGAYALMLFTIWKVTDLSAKSKRLRRGIMRIVELRSGGIGITIAISLLTLGTAFSGAGTGGSHIINSMLLIFVLLFCVVMVLWIQFEIKSEYALKLREKDIRIIEELHMKKDGEIMQLIEDNDSLSATLRLDNELIPLLADALHAHADQAEMDDTVKKLEDIYSSRSTAVNRHTAHNISIKDTGILSVNSILYLMAAKAEASRVSFELIVEADMRQMISAVTERSEFDIILSDLTENAIISAKERDNGAVAVNIRKAGENYCLEVLDSGRLFDKEILKNAGRKQMTTHAGEGGSGIGLKSVFKILRSNEASFEIEEFPHRDDEKFTKAVRVIFDRHARMRIITDRVEELNKSLKGSRFEITAGKM